MSSRSRAGDGSERERSAGIASQRLEPQVLTASGFGFEHADLTSAVSWLVR